MIMTLQPGESGNVVSRRAPARLRRGTIVVVLVLACAVAATLAVVALTGAEPVAREFPARPQVSASGMPLATTAYPVPGGAVFVSTGGADSAAGTEAAPLRTVLAAVDRAPQGGTVVIREGTYRESVGMVRKRVTIQPFPRERVWLKGSVVVSGWQRTGTGWRHDGWHPDLCHDCFLPEIIDPEHPYAGLPDMAFVDGRPLRQVGSADAVRPGTFYVDQRAGTLTVGDDPAGHTVEAAAYDHLLQFEGQDAAGSSIRGIGIAQYASNQDYGRHGAMVIANAPGVTLSRDTFGWSASTGVLYAQPGGRVKASTFLGNGLAGLVAEQADDIRLTGNTFNASNQEHFALTGNAIGAAGVKITRTKHPYVADNYFVNNLSSGWWCDLGCTNATVVRNLAQGNEVNGLYYEVSSAALFASNVMADNHGNGMKISSSDRVRIYQNTFSGNATDIGLYNDPRSPDTDDYSKRLGLTWVTSGTTLVNNLFADRDPARPVIESADYKEPPAGPKFVTLSDGNAYLRGDKAPSAPLLIWSLGGGRTEDYDSLADFRAATGQDRASIEAAVAYPPFNDKAAGDFGLTGSAPGRRAGTALPHDVAAAIGVLPLHRPDIGVLAGPRPN
jgi:poly(beta-D-mannuronate) C5 epimerase